MLAPENHSAASRIPVELINEIVKGAKHADLKSFSLVSAEWVGLCQGYLFRKMRVDPGEYHPIFDQGRHLWQYIRSLTIDSLDLEESTAGNAPEYKPVGQDHEGFPGFLHGLNRVESLDIHDLRWSVLPTAALRGLVKIFNKPMFKRLSIFPNAFQEGFPLALLCHCPSLKTLEFHHPDAFSTEVVPSIRYLPGLPMKFSWVSPLRVSDLTLEGGETINIFMRLLKDEDREEGSEEEDGNEESGEEANGEGGEELMIEDQKWRGLVQLDQLSRLCLGYLDEDLDEKDNVSCLLKRCGPSLVDLTLRFERHNDETEMGYGIQKSAVGVLAKLRRLTMFYSCPDAESFTLDGAEEWFFPFLLDLPSSNQLKELDISWVIYHKSSLDHVERHMLRQLDNFMKTLEKLILERLTHLRHFRFETRTPWDCSDEGKVVDYSHQDLPEYKELVRRLRSSLKLRGVRVKIILA